MKEVSGGFEVEKVIHDYQIDQSLFDFDTVNVLVVTNGVTAYSVEFLSDGGYVDKYGFTGEYWGLMYLCTLLIQYRGAELNDTALKPSI